MNACKYTTVYTLRIIQVCKCASKQVFKYEGMQVCKYVCTDICMYAHIQLSDMQPCNFTTI